MNYKLNLGKTDFKLNELHINKQEYIDLWYSDDMDNKLHHSKNHSIFINLDGPMYSNGAEIKDGKLVGGLHFGHFANKVMKDSICRFKRLCDVAAPFFVTSDQHGLPIEIAVEKKSDKTNTLKFLDDCRDYAKEQFDIQFEQVKQFGVMASNTTYATSDFEYEALQMSQLYRLYKLGHLKQKLRPVQFCRDCGSSLAEAEVEYKDKESDSLIVKFQVAPNTYLLVWTTTPYTLTANKAVAFNHRIQYVKWFDISTNEYYIASKIYVDSLDTDIKYTPVYFGSNNNYMEYEYELSITDIPLAISHAVSPTTNDIVPILNADYVSNSGTGLVHIAPSFGVDDYQVGISNNLPVEVYLDNSGRFVTEGLEGKTIKEVNALVLEYLKNANLAYSHSKIQHSTGHCWRHKTPLFFKASTEWFFELDNAMKYYDSDKVSFYPVNSKNRLDSMMKNRHSWCISRNRKWGVPIPFFYDIIGNIHPDNDIYVDIAIKLVLEKGINAWHTMEVPDGVVKSTQIADVWFDSALLNEYLTKGKLLTRQADLFLEGTDQHRGWFNSSMILGLSNNQQSPFKQLVTHGFVVDEHGRKLSKSNGNYVSMDDLFKQHSPDVLRLLVLSQNYENDMVLSKTLLTQITEQYKKIRNTFRFCMQNLQDFDCINLIEIVDLEDYIGTHQLEKMVYLENKVYKAMNEYDFKTVVYEIYQYAEDCSKYFDTIKDTLYCDSTENVKRRNAQSVLFHLANNFHKLISFILPYTGEEVHKWLNQFNNGFNVASVALTTIDSFIHLESGKELSEFLGFDQYNSPPNYVFSEIAELKSMVLKEYESMRNTEYKTLSQFEVTVPKQYFSNDELKIYLGVAKVDNGEFGVTYTQGKKCPRCWSYHYDTTELCNRCESVENGCFKKGVDSIGKLD